MRSTILLLVLAFSSAQGISFTDCPCDSLCETKNACPDAKRHESSDDCCSRNSKSRQTTENCLHLEPQTDVDRTSFDSGPVPVLILAILDLSNPPAPVVEELPVRSRSGLSPPLTDAPLFLLYSTLAI